MHSWVLHVSENGYVCASAPPITRMHLNVQANPRKQLNHFSFFKVPPLFRIKFSFPSAGGKNKKNGYGLLLGETFYLPRSNHTQNERPLNPYRRPQFVNARRFWNHRGADLRYLKKMTEVHNLAVPYWWLNRNLRSSGKNILCFHFLYNKIRHLLKFSRLLKLASNLQQVKCFTSRGSIRKLCLHVE